VQQHLAKAAPNNCMYLRPQTQKYDTKRSIKPVRIRCGTAMLAFAFFDQVWAGHDPDLLALFAQSCRITSKSFNQFKDAFLPARTPALQYFKECF